GDVEPRAAAPSRPAIRACEQPLTLGYDPCPRLSSVNTPLLFASTVTCSRGPRIADWRSFQERGTPRLAQVPLPGHTVADASRTGPPGPTSAKAQDRQRWRRHLRKASAAPSRRRPGARGERFQATSRNRASGTPDAILDLDSAHVPPALARGIRSVGR